VHAAIGPAVLMTVARLIALIGVLACGSVSEEYLLETGENRLTIWASGATISAAKPPRCHRA
jgi:hypothetical protein